MRVRVGDLELRLSEGVVVEQERCVTGAIDEMIKIERPERGVKLRQVAAADHRQRKHPHVRGDRPSNGVVVRGPGREALDVAPVDVRVPPDERTTKHLDRIGLQVTLANDIITQLLNLIRDRPLTRAQVDLGALVAEAVSSLGDEHLTFTATANVLVKGDATQLRQVVVNLAQNALFFAGPEGRVEIALVSTLTGAILTVDDSGPGIDPSIRNRLFEPLVTTRPGGIGLGLALVRRVVERHWGSVAASRGPLGGARFTVQLPLWSAGDTE